MYLIDKLPALCPEGEVEFTPDLDGLIKWLERQEPGTTYNKLSTDDCLLCRFISAVDGARADWQRVIYVLPPTRPDGQGLCVTRHVAYGGVSMPMQTYSAG
jgi:hypothetical protein